MYCEPYTVGLLASIVNVIILLCDLALSAYCVFYRAYGVHCVSFTVHCLCFTVYCALHHHVHLLPGGCLAIGRSGMLWPAVSPLVIAVRKEWSGIVICLCVQFPYSPQPGEFLFLARPTTWLNVGFICLWYRQYRLHLDRLNGFIARRPKVRVH